MFSVVFIIVFLVLLSYAWASDSAAPWVPCRQSDIKRILDVAHLTRGMRIYEIGCGDGRILFEAARRGADAAGCEISLLPYAIAKIKSLVMRGHTPRIEYRNLWSVPLNDYDLVIVFLTPRIMKKLRAKLISELTPRARILCYVFAMPDWKPLRTDKPPGHFGVYLYEAQNHAAAPPAHDAS